MLNYQVTFKEICFDKEFPKPTLFYINDTLITREQLRMLALNSSLNGYFFPYRIEKSPRNLTRIYVDVTEHHDQTPFDDLLW